MATDKQIAANRANAQKSSGPRTEEGKAASSRNNFRHGLTIRGFIVLSGQEDAFELLEADLRSHLVPLGPVQEIVFKRALESAWNLERCRQAAVTLHARAGSSDVDPLLDLNNAASYSNIQKYAREAENSLYKAMRELGKLQAEKQFRHEKFPLTQAQRENDEDFEKSAHSVSEVCNLAEVMTTVSGQIQVEAKTNCVKMDTELKALANLPPLEYIRRFEANWPPAAAAEPQPEVARAAAA